MNKRILCLTLEKKWFDLIEQGKKKFEFRYIKPYYESRLLNKSYYLSGQKLDVREYDEVHFRNGYRKNSPFMSIEWKGLTLGIINGEKCFVIHLGDILEVKR